MADKESKATLPSRGGSYVRAGDSLQRVQHTKPATEPLSRRQAADSDVSTPPPSVANDPGADDHQEE
jgi:hypothetical protein